jgi:hypothetical protein
MSASLYLLTLWGRRGVKRGKRIGNSYLDGICHQLSDIPGPRRSMSSEILSLRYSPEVPLLQMETITFGYYFTSFLRP